jgi:hypothetical protein
MSLDNNYPSSNLSPDPTTSALGGNHYLLDLGSSVKLQAASDLTRYPIYCRIKTERKDLIDMKKLEKLGFKKIPTEPGFTMYELSPATLEAKKLKNKVRKKLVKIIIKD